MMRRCVAIHFQVKISKVNITPVVWNESHAGYQKFLPCPVRGCVHTWRNHFICGIHTTREGAMYRHTIFRMRKVESQGHTGHSTFLAFPFYSSVPISTINYIWDAHTQPIRSQCVAQHFQVKGQRHMGNKVKVKRVSCNFCRVRTVASSIFDQITSYVVYTQDMRGRCVAHHFQDERSMVKDTQVVRNFSRVFFLSPSLFHRFTSYDIHTLHMKSQCAALHFQDEMSKVKLT